MRVILFFTAMRLLMLANALNSAILAFNEGSNQHLLIGAWMCIVAAFSVVLAEQAHRDANAARIRRHDTVPA